MDSDSPFWTHFWGTLSGVVGAALVIGFFTIIWERSGTADETVNDVEAIRASLQVLISKIARLEASEGVLLSDQDLNVGPPNLNSIEKISESYESVVEKKNLIEQEIDKEVYRMQELSR